MNTTAQIVAIIAVFASLFLVTRNYRSFGLTGATTIKMALGWAIIIMGIAVVITMLER